MREQVSVVPPSERRMSITTLTRREEIKEVSGYKDSRKWANSESKNMEKVKNLTSEERRDQRTEKTENEPTSYKVKKEEMASSISGKIKIQEFSVLRESETGKAVPDMAMAIRKGYSKEEISLRNPNTREDMSVPMDISISVSMSGSKPASYGSMAKVPGKDTTALPGLSKALYNEKDEEKNTDRVPSSDGAILLQWGHRKRPRCSRTDNHHSQNYSHPHHCSPQHLHLLKHKSTLADESSVLSRKTIRVKADKIPVGEEHRSPKPSSSCHGVNTRLHQPKPESQGDVNEPIRKRPKLPRESTPSDSCAKAAQWTPSFEHIPNKRGIVHNQDSSIAPKSRTSADRDRITADHRNGGGGGGLSDPYTTHGHESLSAKVAFEWPKFLICLSRKEKEDDFLIIKGTKLPQRPKRRPKTVEKALFFCTPGTWLTDLTHGRYEVREKRCTKKKPRGLKAMESIESDSD